MHHFRALVAKDIIVDFLPPARKQKTDKVVIFLDGLPSVPGKADLMDFFTKQGYWALHPRYRGTWESRGVFLADSPEKDVLDVVSALSKPLKDLWTKKQFRIKPVFVLVVGVSFGGTASVLLSLDPRVHKSIAIAPVVDWQSPELVRADAKELSYMQEAFGPTYRFSLSNWKKLMNGKFYNPVRHANEIDPEKLLIIHAKDDDAVAFRPVAKFAAAVDCTFIPLSKGGHLSSTVILKPNIYKKIKKFINEAHR